MMADRDPRRLGYYASARKWLGRRPTVDEQRLLTEIAYRFSTPMLILTPPELLSRDPAMPDGRGCDGKVTR
jgi:hypothetical protein